MKWLNLECNLTFDYPFPSLVMYVMVHQLSDHTKDSRPNDTACCKSLGVCQLHEWCCQLHE